MHPLIKNCFTNYCPKCCKNNQVFVNICTTCGEKTDFQFNMQMFANQMTVLTQQYIAHQLMLADVIQNDYGENKDLANYIINCALNTILMEISTYVKNIQSSIKEILIQLNLEDSRQIAFIEGIRSQIYYAIALIKPITNPFEVMFSDYSQKYKECIEKMPHSDNQALLESLQKILDTYSLIKNSSVPKYCSQFFSAMGTNDIEYLKMNMEFKAVLSAMNQVVSIHSLPLGGLIHE